MSSQPQPVHQLVDAEQLRNAIQSRLNAHRDRAPHFQIDVDCPVFDDGFWRSVVHPRKQNVTAGDYAQVLAAVEEEVFDDFGVNVMLIPTSGS